MSNINRRDFLKKGMAVTTVGFVSVNGLLLPRESAGASPALGIIVTSLLQVVSAYLYARSRYKLSAFIDQYAPYDKETTNYMRMGLLSGDITQKSLFSGNNRSSINNFSHISDGTSLSLRNGRGYMEKKGNHYNNYNGIYNPAELELAHRSHEMTGYELFPSENKETGFYNPLTQYQRDLVRERAKEDKELRKFGELGQDYIVQGAREFVNTRNDRHYMMTLERKNDFNIPRRLSTALIAV